MTTKTRFFDIEEDRLCECCRDVVATERRMRALEDKILVSDGCWEWVGSIQSEGYGTVSIRGRNFKAHRVVYELLVGPVPEGLVLDHTCHGADDDCAGGVDCRHRRCVRPDHLEPVEHAENIRRGRLAEAVAARSRAKTHCPHGHPYAGDNLVVTPAGYRRCRACLRASNIKARAS